MNAPSACKRRAMAKPRPEVAPVTIAVWSENLLVVMVFGELFIDLRDWGNWNERGGQDVARGRGSQVWNPAIGQTRRSALRRFAVEESADWYSCIGYQNR